MKSYEKQAREFICCLANEEDFLIRWKFPPRLFLEALNEKDVYISLNNVKDKSIQLDVKEEKIELFFAYKSTKVYMCFEKGKTILKERGDTNQIFPEVLKHARRFELNEKYNIVYIRLKEKTEQFVSCTGGYTNSNLFFSYKDIKGLKRLSEEFIEKDNLLVLYFN